MMSTVASSILDLLLKLQLIDDRAHDAVVSRARSRGGGHIVQQVAELGLATESSIARAISVELGLPRIDLQMTPPESAALNLLDARTCAAQFVLPVALRENGELLWLAMADPTDQDAIALVRRRAQKRVRPAVAGPSEILRAIRQRYGAPGAGAQEQPEEPPAEKLAAIELDDTNVEEVQVVGLMDESASPLARIAADLGLEAAEDLPSRRGAAQMLEEAGGDEEPPAVSHATPPRPIPRIPPPTPAPPTRKDTRPQDTGPIVDPEPDLFETTDGGAIAEDDLTEDDLASLDALRQSLEKGAIVMRSVAELCVEKGVITVKEMRRKRN
jgi:Type II secretion system (T2SS), protein E, N-terminal domain